MPLFKRTPPAPSKPTPLATAATAPSASTAPAEAAAGPVAPAEERRRHARFAINPDFPLKAVLSYVGRDDEGRPLSASRSGWHWKGRLIDCSEAGARIQLGPGLRAVIGENCDLRLNVQEFELVVPCHVTHIRETPEGTVFGVRHDITDETLRRDYHQFVEVMALASTLRLRTRTPKPDDTGYLVERYASSRPSCLTVWRRPEGGEVAAFEFILKDNLVRAAAGHGLEYFAGDGTGSRAATAVRCLEIHRLFQWVVPNLPAAVPADVRAFLANYA